MFDIAADGQPLKIGWTAANAPVGFLALDRNGNGRIDDGIELFGNHTPAGSQTAGNGFQALAFYDRPENGGNGDGWIDANDAIFPRLLLWIDANHDGISQPDELFPLWRFGITRISGHYAAEMRRDRYGNQFRLRSTYIMNGNPRVGYDVYFATESSSLTRSERLPSLQPTLVWPVRWKADWRSAVFCAR